MLRLSIPTDIASRRSVIRLVRKLFFPFTIIVLLVVGYLVLRANALTFLPTILTTALLLLYVLAIHVKASRPGDAPFNLPIWLISFGYILVTLYLSSVYLFTDYQLYSLDAVWLLYLIPIGVTSYWGTTRAAICGLVFSGMALIGMFWWLDTTTALHSSDVSTLSRFLSIVTPSLFLSVLGITTLVILRMLITEIIRERVVDETLMSLYDVQNPRPQANFLAAQLRRKLRFESVYILLWDDETKNLSIEGSDGKVPEDLGKLQVDMQRGIAGDVLRTGQAINEGDLNTGEHCTERQCTEYTFMNSELAVPIGKNPPYGVLDFQSTRLNEFSSEDDRIARVLGAALAVSFNKAQIKTTLDWEWIRSLGKSNHGTEPSIDALFQQICSRSLDGLFEQSPAIMVLYSLVPETGGFPATPAIWHPLDAIWYPDKMRSLPLDWKADDVLFRLIDRWEFACNHNDIERSTFKSKTSSGFVERERIASTIFVPIGAKTGKLGALFANYRTRAEFSKHDLEIIHNIALVIEHRMTEVWRTRQLTRAANRIPHQIHEILGKDLPAILNNLELINSKVKGIVSKDHAVLVPAVRQILDSHAIDETKLTEIYQLLAERECTNDEVTRDLGRTITNMESAFRKDAILAAQGHLWDYQRLKTRGIVNICSGSLRESSPKHPVIRVEITDEVDDLLEALPDAKEAICDLLVEAILNAIRRGEADVVRVIANLANNAINVTVTDNGKGFDPEPYLTGKKPGGPQGIFDCIRMLKEDFASPVATVRSTLGSGAEVRASIPILTGRSHYG